MTLGNQRQQGHMQHGAHAGADGRAAGASSVAAPSSDLSTPDGENLYISVAD